MFRLQAKVRDTITRYGSISIRDFQFIGSDPLDSIVMYYSIFMEMWFLASLTLFVHSAQTVKGLLLD